MSAVMRRPHARAVNAFPLTEHSEGESLFYIISPKDIVVAKERDQDDHIDWLLEKKKYEVCVIEPRPLTKGPTDLH